VFRRVSVVLRKNLPLLGTVPALKKGDRDEDDDGLLAMASLDLEIPGVSIMPPSAHRLSQMTCSVYVCVPGLRKSFTGNEARSSH
jgi:hypothetical protein